MKVIAGVKGEVQLRVCARLLAATVVWAAVCSGAALAQEVPVRTLELAPGAGNPRNSEGSFVALKDGRILFVYSHYTAGSGADHDPARLVARYSSDGGRTWTKEDRLIVANEGGMNVMSVSLLRLRSGEIALFYLLKNSGQDCRPVMRLSQDEGETWGEPVTCVTDTVGYYILNNDRAIQLRDGRLVLPVCRHSVKGEPKADWDGTLMCYLSDDNGKTWRRSKTAQKTFDAAGRRVTTQEPGVVELKDGRVMMFIRASGGCQYLSYSSDGGDTWSAPVASDILSPLSPASIKRLPSTGDLLLVWNDHSRIPAHLLRRRVPLSTAISKDDGKTWQHVKALEGNPVGHYCYIAIHPVNDAVLLGYCAMSNLGHSRITSVPLSWLYAEGPAAESAPPARLFDGVPEGPVERLETPLGVWTAEPGHAAVYATVRGTGIRLQGGSDRTVTLTLPEAKACGELLAALAVERFTALAPYTLTLEAQAGEAWQTVWEQGAATPVGRACEITGSEKKLQTARLRFRCTSARGAIIYYRPEVDLRGFFKD